MSITQKSRWDDAGQEPPAGQAKYVGGEQPIAEYDNWINKALVDDIAAIIKHLFDALYPEAQNPPDMTLKINSGRVYFGSVLLDFPGGNTPTFTAPTTNPRIDLVTIDSTGTLAIIQGTEAASPTPPTYPTDNKIVICEVYHRVGETSIKTDDDGVNGYIYKDVRPYVRAGLEYQSNKNQPNGYAGLDAGGLLSLSQIPSTLTGKDADTVDGKHASDLEQVANKNQPNGYAGLDASALVPLAQIPTPLTGKDADSVDGVHLPATISSVLTDHNLSNHESLGIRKITFDTSVSVNKPASGSSTELYVETDTNIIYRGTGTGWQEVGRKIGFDFPNTIANILSDHNKANHDSLLIDADTVDGIHGTAFEQTSNKNVANGYAGLDSNGKLSPTQIYTITRELYDDWGDNALTRYEVLTPLFFDSNGNIVKINNYRPDWTISGSASVSGGEVHLPSTDTQNYIYTPNTLATGTYICKVHAPVTNWKEFDFFFQATDNTSNNGVYTQINFDANNYFRLRKIVSGSSTILLDIGWTPDSNTHEIKATRDSSGNYELFLDGVSKGTVNDTTFTTNSYMILYRRLLSGDDVMVSQVEAY